MSHKDTGPGTGPDQAQAPRQQEGSAQGGEETTRRRDTTYPLLPLLKDDSLEVLRELGPALERVWPLKPKHRDDLPLAVRDLSAALTTERSGLAGGYLQTPRTLAAYAHYFMPWNVYRQARIFAGQWLRLHEGSRILDLGAGPLTSVLALWTARPDLRGKELHFTCVDRARKAMRLGLDVFKELSRQSGSRWRIEMLDQPLEMFLRKSGPPADLLLMGNVLNEMRWPNILPLEDSVAEFADKVLSRLHVEKQGHLLLVEPGTRFGGRITSLFRKACMERGLMPLSPCTHHLECPMLERGNQAWCHFRFDTSGVPAWLEKLSDQANLPKETLAVSFAHLAAVQARHEPKARVISAAISLPDRGSSGYYACTDQGLVLVETKQARLKTGELVDFTLQPGRQRDRKSGALMAELPPEEEQAHTRTAPKGGDKKPGPVADKPREPRPQARPDKDRKPGGGNKPRSQEGGRFEGAKGRDGAGSKAGKGGGRRGASGKGGQNRPAGRGNKGGKGRSKGGGGSQ